MKTGNLTQVLSELLCATVAEAAVAGRLLVAGGGTGGHLFPGITIAQEFIARNPLNKVLFVSAGNRFEQGALDRAGFPLKRIAVAGLKGRGVWPKIKSLSLLPVGMFQSMGILRTFRPDLVLGVGSYAAGPIVLAAWITGTPVVLHEQNILPGITNRVLACFARRIYVSFENTAGGFNPEKVRLTGNPVRKEILLTAAADLKDDGPISAKAFLNLLIVGGSQGAHAINMAMIGALPSIAQKERLRVVHQTGAADESQVRAAYKIHGMEATVGSFFNNMDHQYQQADLIICRAGATTVAEITAIGKAALFIPFPFAADDHQKLNAAALTAHGAAEMIEEKELSDEKLADRINYYVHDRESLARMADIARRLGRPEAARRIVDDCYRLIGD
jgi:UDP-N-acetylglucosamine--N-acetylmuramyl-(pentapeptide) pyrophosphoryl-undecaprenol N-acetylglucosamine transferase